MSWPESESLPAAWKCYLAAFDRFLLSSSAMEARATRRRMDRHLSYALGGVALSREKRGSSLEADELLRVPESAAALGV
jgi:hypothetical protein